MSSFKEIAKEALWPHPFSGSGDPLQVSTNSGLLPYGKVFVAPFNLTMAALETAHLHASKKLVIDESQGILDASPKGLASNWVTARMRKRISQLETELREEL